MQTLVITGPRSDARHVKAFRSIEPKSELLESPSFADVTERVRDAGVKAVVIFGGDGTLNRYLALLHAAHVPLLMFPTGSGNDFAMANGIFTANDAMSAWQAFRNGGTQAVDTDLGCVRLGDAVRWFSCGLNIGLDADAAVRTNRLPNWLKSRKGYFIGGMMAVLRYQPQTLHIEGDLIPTIAEAGWFVSVSNTPTYGGGLKIAPAARIRDGLLDITYLQPTDRLTLMRHFPKILSGTHVRLPIVHIFQTRRIKVGCDVTLPVYADGEYLGQTPVEVSVVPAAIRVIAGP